MTDLEYYQKLDDYEEIKDYLEIGSDDFVLPNFPPFTPDFSNAIIVDNIPAVGQDKIPKLMQVLLKIYGQIEAKIQETDIYMPYNEETSLTYGFCSIKFETNEAAENAIKITEGFSIDKKHQFRVSLYNDLDRYTSVSEEFLPAEPPAFKPRPDPTSWLTDTQCRDQFSIRYGTETEISWANQTGEEPTVVYAGEREKAGGKVWCESYVQWSPQGTYLATFHTPGIKLWGSNEFESQGRFMHSDVESMDFSPCESYMVTYRFASNGNPAEAIVVWDVRTGAKLRTFPLKNPLDKNFQVQAIVTEDKAGKEITRLMRGRVVSYEGDNQGGSFSIQEGNVLHEKVSSDSVKALQEPNRLKWSADGKYLARLGCDIIQVYELPSMTLLDKKSIAAKDVLDFTWSPRSSMISYWSPAVGNHPALINIIKLPERLDICSRKLFDVSDGRMVWQNDGDYLCVYMTKIQGKKKTYVLMFFRVLETEVPVEQLELTEPILSVTWEPSGDRVAIVHGETRTPTISFYSMSGVSTKAVANAKGRKEFTQLFTLSGVQCNDVIWSPAGGVVALTYYAPDCCVFELHDVENNVSLATRRHDRGNKLVWDPTGRYVASCTITPLRNAAARGQTDDGFNIYTFQGTPLCQVKKDKLFQFNWRPRPKDLLLPEEKKKVIKNLKKYEKVFDKEDRSRKQELHLETMASRHRTASEFLERISVNIAANAILKQRRVAIRDGYDSDDDKNYIVDVKVEEVMVSSKEQIIQ